MMLMQQGTEVKPPDGGSPGKGSKQKGSLGSAANLAGSTAGPTTEQQAQQCPRCDSLNTKFCYFNNYSTSQPRHFCKNCRRYWTRGGALRNVPVGGGCRKNKRLKHRDPSCMAAFAEVGPSGASNMLAAISGCGIPGFGPSSSSLMEDLAQEENRQLTLSRLAGIPVFDKRFLTDNEHCQSGAASTQEFFPFGAGAAPLPGTMLSPFDPSHFSFPALPNFSKPESQPLLFHQHHQTSHELSVFFNPGGVTSPLLTPSLEQFAAAAPAPASHHNMENGLNTGVIDSQMSLIPHGVHMNVIPEGHHDIHAHDFHQQQQQAAQTSASEEDFADGNVGMNMMKGKGRPLVSFFSDWTAGAGSNTLQQDTMASSNNTDAFYNAPPQVGEGTLWNASWPEMHAALAGSTAAGAMLH